MDQHARNQYDALDVVGIIILITVLISCSSSEQKKMKNKRP
jgi:hypothetical protein